MEEDIEFLTKELSNICKYSHLTKINNRYIIMCDEEKGINNPSSFLFLREHGACVATEIYKINSTPHTRINLKNMDNCPYKNL
jgi:hypothetical protein